MQPLPFPTARSPQGFALIFAAFVLMLAFLSATGCASAVATPQTFDDKVAVASQSIQTITAGATTLASSGKISKAAAQNVLTASRTASATLSSALALKSSDPVGANQQLAVATGVLDALKSFLVSNGATPQ